MTIQNFNFANSSVQLEVTRNVSIESSFFTGTSFIRAHDSSLSVSNNRFSPLESAVTVTESPQVDITHNVFGR